MTYLVTGATSGIGRATAVRLAERGHDVIAGVRRVADAPSHPRIRPLALDVTDAAQLAAAREEVGQLQGLVNNAGVTFAGPMEHLPLDRLREQLEINVVGLVAVTQAFLPAVRAGRGRIVMISSAGGRVTTPLLGAYSASKYAVEAIADALRRELRPWNLPVVVIEPGSFKSRNRDGTEEAARADRAHMGELAESRYGHAMDALTRFNRNVEARAGDPEQVAAVVERALTTGRPRARYLVGNDARAVVAMARFLPVRTMDAMLCRTMGIHEHTPHP
ncbi:SDR family oxidoreductase [Mangrovihabitans endophyticus]|uniref:Short-chain dehydrogenase/reductase n=1 Tax=Mangrovihabitans endophyticus TaxID=1751298 RepID=A0A8J3BZY7_9ACTN|nr:SDR family oxidoreductase [Mangrovihabitans endophyticus]GGK88685.1 short-chain dehydrogenase/reductase [Mangrovihabitans endophyticus]